MNKEKIIFLDIDGVLNPNVNIHMRKLKGEPTCADSIKLPGDKLYRLKRICTDTGAKVVVSSSWRIGFKRDASIPSPSHINLYNQTSATPSPAYINFYNQASAYGIPVIGWTPLHTDRNRGREISHWIMIFIKNNGYKPNYVIIDDNISDIVNVHRGHVIQTSTLLGLQDEHVNIAISILNK